MNKTSNTLVFCVALNGYERIYESCIESQREYAARHDYQYRLINRPGNASITASAWLKIPLLLEALLSGYEWVAFIDADCQIKPETPALESLEKEGKCLYMGQGFSGRVNSGVIIAKNETRIIDLFERILENSNNEVAESDWGENGHLIHFTKDWDGLHILDRRWNNNAEPLLKDYIRHYSAGGPMRELYPASRSEAIWRFIYRWTRVLKRRKYLPREQTHDAINQLMLRVAVAGEST